jgi:hypothetical protein
MLLRNKLLRVKSSKDSLVNAKSRSTYSLEHECGRSCYSRGLERFQSNTSTTVADIGGIREVFPHIFAKIGEVQRNLDFSENPICSRVWATHARNK